MGDGVVGRWTVEGKTEKEKGEAEMVAQMPERRVPVRRLARQS